MKNIYELKNYINGVSCVLNDYLPEVFPENAIECRYEKSAYDEFNEVEWSLNLEFLDKPLVVKNGIFICPDNGVVKPFDKELITPFVLIEKRARFLKEIRTKKTNKEYKKFMDLEDFHIIRGAFLAKALQICDFVIECFYDRREDSPQKKKPLYTLSDKERRDQVMATKSFKLKLTSLLNNTFNGTETMPVYVINDDHVVQRIRFVKCHGYLPFLTKNSLHYESEKRKIVYHSQKASKYMRYPHYSHLGRIDMLETPESEAIGLSLFLARGGVYNPSTLSIDLCEDFDLKAHPEQAFSLSSSAVPFLHHSDGPRVSMGGKNLKQSIKVVGSESPMLKTGMEDECSFNFGVNALVGYMLYNGMNFEDGIVISKSFAERMRSKKIKRFKGSLLIDMIRSDEFICESDGDFEYMRSYFRRASSPIKEGDYRYRISYKFKVNGTVYDSDPLLSMLVERDLCVTAGKRGGNPAEFADDWKPVPFSIREEKLYKNYENEFVLLRYSGLYPAFVRGYERHIRVMDYAQILKIGDSEKKTKIDRTEIVFNVEEERPFEIGDKMTGRHGNKSTVSRILSDDEMPRVLIDGKERSLDCVISPMSVVSRMNTGQLLEIHSTIAWGDCQFKPFDKVDVDKLLADLKKLGADDWGYFKLVNDGRRIAAGYQYVVRLDHCVRNKFHCVSKASTSVLNGQPLKGRKRNGGQRIGEMEFWTLFNHGAFNIIEDFARTNLLVDDKKTSELFKQFALKHNKMVSDCFTLATSTEFKRENGRKKYEIQKTVSVEEIYDLDNALKTVLKSEDYEAVYKKITEKSDEDIIFEQFVRKNKKDGLKLINGKDGYLRKHMLGRRIHFSGRTTISPIPTGSINTCYLPVDVGIEWFKDRLGLSKKYNADFIKRAKQVDYAKRRELIGILNEYVSFCNFMIILNRQPSLQRHSMQSFYPQFWEHYSIGLPTLVCEGFGADFDGDTMAFYFPISQFSDEDVKREAVKSELEEMLPTVNPFRLGDRGEAWSTAQDFAYGCFKDGEGGKKLFKKELFDIVQKEAFNKLVEFKDDTIRQASDDELSLSFFDVKESFEKEVHGPFLKNFKNSGARGKDEQFDQLTKEIGILGKDSGKNFGKGLEVSDYLCTTETDHLEEQTIYPIAVRSRRNLMEKKLSVASAGYFTRKLVSFMYPYLVKSEDCGTDKHLVLERGTFEKLKQSYKDLKLKKFILGRYVNIENEWQLIDEEKLREIEGQPWLQLEIRSPLTCGCKDGVCAKCYGADLAKGVLNEKALPEINSFVGLSSGHSLGEFGTQLSMKTFQTGTSFSPDKLSHLFFKRGSKEGYFGYLQRIADEPPGDESLIDVIQASSIHFEILFKLLCDRDIHSETEMKKWFKNFKEIGFLSSLSFESAKGLFEKEIRDELESETVFSELSPSVSYMYANPLLKKVLKNG